jgi:hypothetical protein
MLHRITLYDFEDVISCKYFDDKEKTKKKNSHGNESK